jgi:alkylation response protein AidB-like acyl-CoA dehydrogenase
VTSLAENKLDGQAVAEALDRVLARELDRTTLLDAAHRNEPLTHLHDHLVALGLPVVALEHELSGLDLSLSAIAEVFAVVGRCLVPVAERDETLLLAPMLGLAVRAGDTAAAGWLDRMLAGELRGGARVTVDDPRVAREDAGDHTTIRFDALPVWLAPGAELVILSTPTWSALLDLAEPGLELAATAALDPGQGVTILSGTQAVPLVRVCNLDRAQRQYLTWHVGVAAELIGVAQAMLEASVEYAQSRLQFGKPIATYQAISHRLADMCVAVESSRALLARLIMLADDGHDTSALLTVVRHGVPQAAREVCEGAIQIHGGLGFTWEQGLHLWYRRVLQIQAAFGGPSATAHASGRAYLDAILARDD